MVDGEGIRTVLWVSGCDHYCNNCQNPNSWDAHKGEIFDGRVKEELFSYVDKPYRDGLTLSGGDPLYIANRNAVVDLCKDFKLRYGNTKTIWLYTGYVWEDILYWDIVYYIDVLVDGLYVNRLRDETLKWCGSSNQRVIDVQKSIKMGKVVLWE